MGRIITYVCDICGNRFFEKEGICVTTYNAHHVYDFCNDCKDKACEFINKAEINTWVGGAKNEGKSF